jgi:diguanylate cyclase (GGDEF)-like protein
MLAPIQANLLGVVAFLFLVGVASAFATRRALSHRFQSRTQTYEQQIALLTQKLDETTDISHRDLLTGAYNSNQIEPMLTRRIEEARAKREPFVLILIDIDGFKRINDTYDHEVGNSVLAQFAREITPRSAADILIRYGGDEFLIISKLGTDVTGGYGFAQRLRREIGDFEFLVEKNSPRRERLTISCGVTGFISDQDDSQAMRQRVAQALHEAKQPRTGPDGVIKAKDFVFVLSGEEDRL